MHRWPCHQGLKISFTSRRLFSFPSSLVQISGSSGMCRARSLPRHRNFQSVRISCSILRLFGAFYLSFDPLGVEFSNKGYVFSRFIVENDAHIYFVSRLILTIFVAIITLSVEKELIPTGQNFLDLNQMIILFKYRFDEVFIRVVVLLVRRHLS